MSQPPQLDKVATKMNECSQTSGGDMRCHPSQKRPVNLSNFGLNSACLITTAVKFFTVNKRSERGEEAFQHRPYKPTFPGQTTNIMWIKEETKPSNAKKSHNWCSSFCTSSYYSVFQKDRHEQIPHFISFLYKIQQQRSWGFNSEFRAVDDDWD